MESERSQQVNDPLTYKIVGCAMRVHRTMGPGFQEVLYQRCLAIELQRAGIQFVREQDQTLYYDGIEVGTRRADFIVEGRIVLEIKALSMLEMVHLAQCKNHTVAYHLETGLLINFGGECLEYQRVFNPKKHLNKPQPKLQACEKS